MSPSPGLLVTLGIRAHRSLFPESCMNSHTGPACLGMRWVGLTRGLNLGWKWSRRFLLQPLPQAGPALGSDQALLRKGWKNQDRSSTSSLGNGLTQGKTGKGRRGGMMGVSWSLWAAPGAAGSRAGKRSLREKTALQPMGSEFPREQLPHQCFNVCFGGEFPCFPKCRVSMENCGAGSRENPELRHVGERN